MSSLIPSGSASGTGAITIQPVNTNNNRTVTIPDADGVVSVSGNMPAFSAYASAGQTLANNTFTKIQINTEEFDTASCFDATTNYRFTPNVAGYYQVSGAVMFTANATNIRLSAIYKNGTIYKSGNTTSAPAADQPVTCVSALVFLNGSTDYVELYALQDSGGSLVTTPISNWSTYFQAVMVRSA